MTAVSSVCKSTPELAHFGVYEHQADRNPIRVRYTQNKPRTSKAKYFIKASLVYDRISQQQLRFVTEGCLLSLKPLPLDGGLVSVDGILRPTESKKALCYKRDFETPFHIPQSSL